MSLKLYGRIGSYRTSKISIVFDILGIPLEIKHIAMTSLKEKEFLEKNPNGKIPVLDTPKGFIYESNSIMRYGARLRPESKIYGADEFEASLIDQFLDMINGEVEPAVTAVLYPILGWKSHIADHDKENEERLHRILSIFEEHLKLRTFLVGNNLSLADIPLACYVNQLFRFVMEEEARNEYPNISRWFNHVRNIPQFLKAFGKMVFCKKRFPPNGKIDEVKEAPKPKAKEQPKKVEQKVVKAEEKPKPEITTPEPTVDSTFNLFDYKTLFVNAQCKKEALAKLYKEFDEKAFSIWYLKYTKAEGEGNVLFQTNNLMNGFLQRMEPHRKEILAVHGVYGQEPSLEIRGVWLFRGAEIPTEIKEVPAFEYHELKKLNLSNPSDKALLEEYWTKTNTGELVEGLEVQTVKYFK